MVGSRDSTGR